MNQQMILRVQHGNWWKNRGKENEKKGIFRDARHSRQRRLAVKKLVLTSI